MCNLNLCRSQNGGHLVSHYSIWGVGAPRHYSPWYLSQYTISMVLTDKKNRLELSPLLQLNNALLGKFKPLKESLICQEPEVMGIDADDDEGEKI